MMHGKAPDPLPAPPRAAFPGPKIPHPSRSCSDFPAMSPSRRKAFPHSPGLQKGTYRGKHFTRSESSGPERKGPVRGQREGEVGTPQLVLAKVGEGSAKSHAGKVGCQKISGTSRAQSSSTELVATGVELLPRPTQHQSLAQHRVLLCRAFFSARSREVNGIGAS